MKIAYSFLMVLDKHAVTMKHYREVDIARSESAKMWPWVTLKRSLKVTKVKLARIVLTVAPRPRVPTDKNVHHWPVNDRGKD